MTQDYTAKELGFVSNLKREILGVCVEIDTKGMV
jgi:hypothetical protein